MDNLNFLSPYVIAPVIIFLLIPSAIYVYQDAKKRGKSGFLTALLTSVLFWPLSLLFWLAMRPETTEKKGKKRVFLFLAILGFFVMGFVFFHYYQRHQKIVSLDQQIETLKTDLKKLHPVMNRINDIKKNSPQQWEKFKSNLSKTEVKVKKIKSEIEQLIKKRKNLRQ